MAAVFQYLWSSFVIVFLLMLVMVLNREASGVCSSRSPPESTRRCAPPTPLQLMLAAGLVHRLMLMVCRNIHPLLPGLVCPKHAHQAFARQMHRIRAPRDLRP